jgi:hypothetical protein
MNKEDLILVSIDDHVVEPPDMFLRHVPAKYIDQAPIVVTDDRGVDQWIYQGRPQGVSGLNAVVSWPPEEWARDPAGFAEMRPGVYDVHQRVKDMSRNGILASMCFPTFTGFSARHLNQFQDPVTLVMVSAYNDWHIDEWAGSYPDRFIPIAVLPTWNPEAMCDEIRRVAAKGCRAVTMPELPHLEGLPSYHDEDYWGPVFRTLSEENVVMCLHIGTGFGAISMAPNAPIDNLIILATQVGVRLPALRLLLAGRARAGACRAQRRGRRRFRHQQDHLEELVPVFSWDPFGRTPKEQATVGALRATATDVDVSIRPRKEWARLYEQKQLAEA